MRYLLDANCFIQPKNTYYGFDFCPGYWQWMDQQHKAGLVYSIINIKNELTVKPDDLATWVRARDRSFFEAIDNDTVLSMQDITAWVMAANFKQQAIPVFMGCADPFVVAHALAHGDTVVSHEKLVVGQRDKVKIPAACQQFNVPYMTVFDLLRLTGAVLTL